MLQFFQMIISISWDISCLREHLQEYVVRIFPEKAVLLILIFYIIRIIDTKELWNP